MKNKKGFTLVELLGVIVILSIMILVTAPALLTTIKNTEDKAIEEFETTLSIAAESYIEQNRISFPQLNEVGGTAYISVGKLKEGGYIKTNLVDPKTGSVVESTSTIKTVVQPNKTRTYEYNRVNYTANGYVQDDFVVMYDAIERPDNNIVKDLTNNNLNLSLLGFDKTSGWDVNKIVFDGNDDRASSYISVDGDFTIEFRFDKYINISDDIEDSSLLTINDWTNEITQNPSLMIYYKKTDSPYIQVRFLAPKTKTNNSLEEKSEQIAISSLSDQNTLSITKTNSKMNVYLNGELKSSITNTNFINRFNMKTMELNFGSLNDNYVSFDFRNFRVYNKALLESEITKNFILDCGRY